MDTRKRIALVLGPVLGVIVTAALCTPWVALIFGLPVGITAVLLGIGVVVGGGLGYLMLPWWVGWLERHVPRRR